MAMDLTMVTGKYKVNIDNKVVSTVVTTSIEEFKGWLEEMGDEFDHGEQNNPVFVGLDTIMLSTTQSAPIAAICICVGASEAIVYQILNPMVVPRLELTNFFNRGSFTLVGVGVHHKLEQINHDFHMDWPNPRGIGKCEDVAEMARRVFADPTMMDMGLYAIARRSLGRRVRYPTCPYFLDRHFMLPEHIIYTTVQVYLASAICSVLWHQEHHLLMDLQ